MYRSAHHRAADLHIGMLRAMSAACPKHSALAEGKCGLEDWKLDACLQGCSVLLGFSQLLLLGWLHC